MHSNGVSIVNTAPLGTLFVVRRYLVGTPQENALLVDGDPGSVVDLVSAHASFVIERECQSERAPIGCWINLES